MEVAELLEGDVMFHTFYASSLPDSEASNDNEDLVPYWYGKPGGLERIINAGHQLQKQKQKKTLKMQLRHAIDGINPSSYVFPLQWRASKVL